MLGVVLQKSPAKIGFLCNISLLSIEGAWIFDNICHSCTAADSQNTWVSVSKEPCENRVPLQKKSVNLGTLHIVTKTYHMPQTPSIVKCVFQKSPAQIGFFCQKLYQCRDLTYQYHTPLTALNSQVCVWSFGENESPNRAGKMKVPSSVSKQTWICTWFLCNCTEHLCLYRTPWHCTNSNWI